MVNLTKPFRFIGHGVYSLAEAGRLTGVPVANLRRWAQGYQYTYRGRERRSPPIIGTGLKQHGSEPILVFRDIIEARFLSAFRRFGVSWSGRTERAWLHPGIQDQRAPPDLPNESETFEETLM